MNYKIIDGAAELSFEEILRLLKMTYWADNRPAEQVKKSIEYSSCYGIYSLDENKLLGFARVISDYATTFYLCDVVIDEDYRGKGLGTALVSHVLSLPEFRDLRGVLITRDAHALYRKFNFEVLNERAMVKNLNC